MKTICTNYFGDCPQCGKNDGFLNVGREHVFRCDEHKVCRSVGSNLFSSWREQSEEDWKRNEQKVASYAKIEPLPEYAAVWNGRLPDQVDEMAQSIAGALFGIDYAIKVSSDADLRAAPGLCNDIISGHWEEAGALVLGMMLREAASRGLAVEAAPRPRPGVHRLITQHPDDALPF